VSARGSYKELFRNGKEPFFEISNFLEPDEIIKKIININPTQYSKNFSELVLSVDWSSGYNSALNEIRLLMNVEV
jgi:hypothetical protein